MSVELSSRRSKYIRKREDNYNPTEIIITDKIGRSLIDTTEVMERWQVYFEELLKQFAETEKEPNILLTEVEQAAK